MAIRSVFKTKYKVTKSLLLLGILTTGLLSAIIGVLAFFGQNMGTFVISLGDNAYESGIILSDNREFTDAYPRLLVNPVNGAECVCYEWIKLDDIVENDGDFEDPDGYKYIAYTFYLRNEGNTIADIEWYIDITSATLDVDKAVRIQVIEDGDIENQSIFWLKDDSKQNKYDYTPECIDFESKTRVVTRRIIDFYPTDFRKFSVIIWLNGWDNDCDDLIQGGQLKLSMNFDIVSSRTLEDNE